MLSMPHLNIYEEVYTDKITYNSIWSGPANVMAGLPLVLPYFSSVGYKCQDVGESSANCQFNTFTPSWLFAGASCTRSKRNFELSNHSIINYFSNFCMIIRLRGSIKYLLVGFSWCKTTCFYRVMSVAYAGKKFREEFKVIAGLVGGPGADLPPTLRTPENFRKFAKEFLRKIAKNLLF